MENMFKETNFLIEPTTNHTFLVRSDSERFGKAAIVFEHSDRSACVNYVSERLIPKEWSYYLIPDLKSWAVPTIPNTPIERYEKLKDVMKRYHELRGQDYNAMFDSVNGNRYAIHLTIGISDNHAAEIDILHVQHGLNVLSSDFTSIPHINTDKNALQAIADLEKEIGFSRVSVYEKGRNGKLLNSPRYYDYDNWILSNPYYEKSETIPYEKLEKEPLVFSDNFVKELGDIPELPLHGRMRYKGCTIIHNGYMNFAVDNRFGIRSAYFATITQAMVAIACVELFRDAALKNNTSYHEDWDSFPATLVEEQTNTIKDVKKKEKSR